MKTKTEYRSLEMNYSIFKPFGTRLSAALIIWLIIVFLLIAGGFLIYFCLNRGNESLNIKLPLQALASTKGEIN